MPGAPDQEQNRLLPLSSCSPSTHKQAPAAAPQPAGQLASDQGCSERQVPKSFLKPSSGCCLSLHEGHQQASSAGLHQSPHAARASSSRAGRFGGGWAAAAGPHALQAPDHCSSTATQPSKPASERTQQQTARLGPVPAGRGPHERHHRAPAIERGTDGAPVSAMAKPQEEPKPAGKEQEAKKGGKDELPEVGRAAIAGCRVSVLPWGCVPARRQPAARTSR